ncbi:hypothetical protein H6P81_017919 [Aristolochia fimbriata]|uniref:Pectinesterase inhibitor domain-containing protein n=1 Tax=Aristolochia fimbriata TaxID=158543 RepID=A0AAV7DZI2_ARIFI|nr:hypothetical protein H6P81_017919 [Aristolochia fimbriata]
MFFFSFTNLSSAENIDLDVIRSVCKTTPEPDFCVSILSADPNSKGKDFHGLAELAINLANEKGKAVVAYVNDLLKKTTERVLKEILGICLSDYDSGVVDGTAEGLDEFNNSNYKSSLLLISGSAAAAKNCDATFDQPPTRENVLKDLNKTMSQYLLVAAALVRNYVPAG